VLAAVFVRNRPGEEAAADPTNARRNAVEAVMKRDVYTLSQDATVYEAVQTLVEKGISAAPVVDGSGVLVGFVSDGDVTRYLAKKNVTFTDPVLLIMLSASEDDTFHERVDQLMELNVMSIATRRVVSADVHTDLPTLCRVLGDNHLKKIPITDGGRLVGVVNRSDIARYSMAQYLQAAERR
jgi:CBS domain-containing protein